LSFRCRRRDQRIVFFKVEYNRAIPDGPDTTIGMTIDATEEWRSELEQKVIAELGTKFSGFRTLDEVAAALRESTEGLWSWDAFTLSVFTKRPALFHHVLAVDTINGKKTVSHPAEYTIQDLERIQPSLVESATLINRPKDEAATPIGKPWGDSNRLSASLMFAPVRVSGELFGHVSVQSYTHDRFDETDLRLLARIAEAAGPAVERSLAESERNRLTAAVEQAHDGIAIVDTNWVIQYVNPAFEKLLGCSKAEAMGRDGHPVPHPSGDGASQLDKMPDTLAQGESWRGRMATQRPDGQRLLEEISVTPVRDAGGRLTHYAILRRDITRETAMEDELRQSQKMESFGMLAGGMAHDFNNLLQILLGHAQVVQLRLPRENPLRGDVDALVRAIKGGGTLTQRLLAFSRKQALQPQRFDLNELVESASRMLHHLVGELVQIKLDLGEGLNPVYADPDQVNSVIVNLVVNARDAMPDGGEILLGTREQSIADPDGGGWVGAAPGRYITLAIQDQGQGMDEETRSRIFEPFFTTKTKGAGTGLGLATVYGIIKQSGGHIRVESRLGAGTLFEILLPVAEGRKKKRDSAPLVNPTFGGLEVVLLVEDNDTVRELTAKNLEILGYRTLKARDGREGLDIASRNRESLKLVITDVIMPEMDGPEMVRNIHQLLPALPVIYISGYTGQEPAAQELLENNIGYLQKPFSPEELARKIRVILDQASKEKSSRVPIP
ncbi:MAG: response regulator, partial [Candidatus Sumerlaeaceae bacterium]|nr:response regulator [Candidatus Sumerlaeaceae bacterium]